MPLNTSCLTCYLSSAVAGRRRSIVAFVSTPCSVYPGDRLGNHTFAITRAMNASYRSTSTSTSMAAYLSCSGVSGLRVQSDV